MAQWARKIYPACWWLASFRNRLSLKVRNACCSVYKGKDEDGTAVLVKVQQTGDVQPAWRAVREVRSWRASALCLALPQVLPKDQF